MAGIFTSKIFERRERVREQAQQEQLQKVFGQQAQPGQLINIPGPGGEPGLVSQLGGRPATGNQAVPLDDRAEALAIASATIPGFAAETSMTMMQNATNNRQQAAMRASEFNRTLFQDQRQFNEKERQDMVEWSHRAGILDAQAQQATEQNILKTAAAANKVKLDGLSEQQKLIAIDQATNDLALLPAPAMKTVERLAGDLAMTQYQLNTFDPRFALNAITIGVGGWELDQAIKNARTDLDRDAIAFWQREHAYQSKWLSDVSGAAVSNEEFERAQRTFIRPDMDAKLMARLYKERFGMITRETDRFVQIWSTEKVNARDRFPEPGEVNNPRLNFGQSGPQPRGTKLPPGANVTNIQTVE